MFNYFKQSKMKVISGLFGGGSKSGSSAADAQAMYNQQAISEMKRQFNITQGNVQPYMDAGVSALGNIESSATAGGLDALLAQIMGGDTFGSLVDERQRGVQGQLAAGGLTRSGTAIQEASNVSSDLALQLESMLTGRQTGIANTGVNAATGLGQMGQSNSNTIASLLSNSGQAVSNGIVTDAQSKAKEDENKINTAVAVAGLFFSDPALKENIEKVSSIKDLGVYQWDWKASTKGTMIDGCSNMGFMADEVQDKYPEHIYHFGGFMMIDYPALLDTLEAN